MLFGWDCNILNLVMGHLKVGIGGGVIGFDDSPDVSSNIRLGLCVEFGKD
jgi:hypothetical protein